MMSSLIQRVFHYISGRNHNSPKSGIVESISQKQPSGQVEIEIASSDPILNFLSAASGVLEIDRLQIDSAALRMMKASGVKLTVPLVSQGELIGLLNLGPRRSEQEYSTDDRRLLYNLATQAAPALRVAQLARQQQHEARKRERLEHELRVARVIQETLLPKELPQITGFSLSAHWQPARAVSGDFYDFFLFPDGRIGIIVADVTDKGVPAALVMATTRTLLREAASNLISPGKVLERANELLVPDIPKNMFVTCLYILLEPKSGEIVCANAGHNLPILCRPGRAEELRVRGMPLGLMPGLKYEEQQTRFEHGQSIFLYSDGLIEAHNPSGEMFETPRLLALLKSFSGGEAQINASLQALMEFTGPDWEQEDDVTLVVLERSQELDVEKDDNNRDDQGLLLADFQIDSKPGNERMAMQKVIEILQPYRLSPDQIERLKTAVAETTMNAMEHGNKYSHDLEVKIKVWASTDKIQVRIQDHGGGKTIPEHVMPNIDAKLAGLQSPRGWGLFLIQNMVDEIHVFSDESHHTVDLLMNFED